MPSGRRHLVNHLTMEAGEKQHARAAVQTRRQQGAWLCTRRGTSPQHAQRGSLAGKCMARTLPAGAHPPTTLHLAFLVT